MSLLTSCDLVIFKNQFGNPGAVLYNGVKNDLLGYIISSDKNLSFVYFSPNLSLSTFSSSSSAFVVFRNKTFLDNFSLSRSNAKA